MNQRWQHRLATYRAPTETIRTTEYEVHSIPDDRTAKQFVLEHHYAGTYPAARFRYGLYHHGTLVGVAVFSVPSNNRVLTNVFGAAPATELGRFVLLDSVPGNGETWFLARCFEQLRGAGMQGVVSFSDPVPRSALDGGQVFPGHVGTIYQAHNARYLGRGTARTLRLLPDGRVLSDRTLQKIRAGERGWHGATIGLSTYGANSLGTSASSAERIDWLRTWLPQLTRPLCHPGNYRYAWGLARGVRLAQARPYPKMSEIGRFPGDL